MLPYFYNYFVVWPFPLGSISTFSLVGWSEIGGLDGPQEKVKTLKCQLHIMQPIEIRVFKGCVTSSENIYSVKLSEKY